MTLVNLPDDSQMGARYLEAQLPVVMSSDEGVARFLRGLDEMASELYERVGQKEHLFDIALAPLMVVRLLAERIGVPIDPLRPEAEQRSIARVAAATFPIRGTRASLEQNLAALTGMETTVEDPGGITAHRAPRVALTSSQREATPWDPPESGGERAAVRIRIAGSGRATVAALIATVTRELQCAVPYEFDPPIANTSNGGT